MYNVIRKQLDTEIQLRKVKKAGVFFCKTFSSEKKMYHIGLKHMYDVMFHIFQETEKELDLARSMREESEVSTFCCLNNCRSCCE